MQRFAVFEQIDVAPRSKMLLPVLHRGAQAEGHNRDLLHGRACHRALPSDGPDIRATDVRLACRRNSAFELNRSVRRQSAALPCKGGNPKSEISGGGDETACDRLNIRLVESVNTIAFCSPDLPENDMRNGERNVRATCRLHQLSLVRKSMQNSCV